MSTRGRTRFVIGLCALSLAVVGILVYPQVRALRVTLTNTTGAPLVDVRLTHPGGTLTIPRVDPGETIRRTIRPAPWNNAGGFETPVELRFQQGGVRSRPFVVRYLTNPLSGLDVAYRIDEQSRCGVDAFAQVVGSTAFDSGQALKALRSRSLSNLQGVITRRHHGWGLQVIHRPDREQLVQDLVRDSLILGMAWSRDPGEARRLLWELGMDRVGTVRPRPRAAAFRLPFRDEREALGDPHSNLIQSYGW